MVHKAFGPFRTLLANIGGMIDRYWKKVAVGVAGTLVAALLLLLFLLWCLAWAVFCVGALHYYTMRDTPLSHRLPVHLDSSAEATGRIDTEYHSHCFLEAMRILSADGKLTHSGLFSDIAVLQSLLNTKNDDGGSSSKAVAFPSTQCVVQRTRKSSTLANTLLSLRPSCDPHRHNSGLRRCHLPADIPIPAHGEKYTLTMQLSLPETQRNLAIGMITVEASVLGMDDDGKAMVVTETTSSARLHHVPWLAKSIRWLFMLVPTLFVDHDVNEQWLEFQLLKDFQVSAQSLKSAIEVSIASSAST